ncbi:MAG: GGDEF domain-containing protein, partial [Selenomonadaceae bacterium]|nr:GGDEF domain-containing protein [Selenomonadaceae bacterium]
TELTEKIDGQIAAGTAKFCIVMIDVNYLKRVNDTYGHERGNEYLINACKLAGSIFGVENIFRIGGDEFVVVLTGDDVDKCKKLIKQINDEIKKFKANDKLQPWEKVSAAVGAGYYREGVDKNCEEVFKRADTQMYKNKLAMKAQRTD